MSIKPSDFFALIIGINEYKSDIRELSGCVADAEAFKKYLQGDLGVPVENITYLTDSNATRSRILQGFSDLATNPLISRNSPICIFYAGHGAEVNPPPGWDSGGRKIQALIPYDFCQDMQHPTPAITDREMANLSNAICEAKGDNITIIFDCCHAASGTRDSDSECEDMGEIRSIGVLDYHIHASMDVISERTSAIPTPVVLGSLDSHILIAACKSTEYAREHNNRGRFSTAFLALLRKKGAHTLRYSDIMEHLDSIPDQHPQCEGNKQLEGRLLFSTHTSSKNEYFHLAEKSSVYTLDGGAIHGIPCGAEFAVYADRPLISDDALQVGSFTVVKFDLYTSTGTLKLSAGTTPSEGHTSSPQYIAVQTSGRAQFPLRVYIVPTSTHPASELPLSKVDIVACEAQAHLAIEPLPDCKATVRVFNPGLTKDQQPKEGPYTLQSLRTILQEATLYFWKRDCANLEPLRPSADIQAEVEFYQLSYRIQERTDCPFYIQGNNLCANEIKITITERPEPYGMKVINKSPYALFPSVFYFDDSNFSILSYYQHSVGGPNCLPEAPLPANDGSLTIGYGSGGAPPFGFTIPEGQHRDVGLVKVFLFTKPVNTSDIPQRSPFDMRTTAVYQPNIGPNARDMENIWGVVTLKIVQEVGRNAASQ